MTGQHPRLTSIGVKGRALCHQATDELAIAQLRPTIPEHDIHRHQHADMHLVLLLAGHYVSEAVGMPAICAEPALILNPPGTEHRDRFRSRDGLFLTLTMSAAAFARLCQGLPEREEPCRLPPQALSVAVRLLPEVWHWEDTSPIAVEGLFSELLAIMAGPMRPAGETDALHRVRERLDEAGPLPSIRELAAIAGHHPVYLARGFRKRYGMAPSEYIRKRRLHRALSLLARGRSVAGAASVLGFVDDSHLHHSFVAEFGMTPGAFRRLALTRAEVARIQEKCAGRC